MKLLIPALFIALFSYGQDSSNYQPSGIVAFGARYTLETLNLKDGRNESTKDTIRSDFKLVLSESQKFIQISGIRDMDSIFDFDTLLIENVIANEYYSESLRKKHFTQRNDFTFKVDYIDDILDGKMRPVAAKWMYDEEWNSVKLYLIYTHAGKNYTYNLFFDEVSYLGWNHELTYSKTHPFVSYGEMDTKAETETTVFEEKESGTLVVNDTSMIIKSGKINLDKTITRSFSSAKENIYMVIGALCAIPKHGDWVFYSFDYDQNRGGFNGYYYFELKEN